LKIEKKYNMEYRQAHNFIIFGDKGSGSAIDYKTGGHAGEFGGEIAERKAQIAMRIEHSAEMKINN
jgi:hypothetical protein